MNDNDNQKQHYQDLHLFEEMKTATDERRNELAWQVVRTHYGYIYNYARMTAMKTWRQETNEDYLSALIEVAHACALRYDLSKTDAAGQRIPFVGVFRAWAKSAKYEVAAKTNPMSESRRSKGVSVCVQTAVAKVENRRETVTTESVLAEIRKTRSDVAASAVARALNPITVTAMPEGRDVAASDNVEDLVIAKLELDQLTKLGPIISTLDDRDRDILSAVMHEESLVDIAHRYGVSRQAISKRQKKLLGLLRDQLSQK